MTSSNASSGHPEASQKCQSEGSDLTAPLLRTAESELWGWGLRQGCWMPAAHLQPSTVCSAGCMALQGHTASHPEPTAPGPGGAFWERTAQAVMGTYSTGSGQCTPCSLDLLGQMEKNPTLEMVPSTSPRCSTSSHSTPHPNAALRAMLCMSASTASSVVLDPAPLFAFQTVPFKSTSNRSALTTECLTAWVQHPGVPCTVLGLSPPPPPH